MSSILIQMEVKISETSGRNFFSLVRLYTRQCSNYHVFDFPEDGSNINKGRETFLMQ